MEAVGRYNVVVHGISFMLIFAAFSTASEYGQAILHGQGYEQLGYQSAGVVYLVFAIANLVAPFTVDKLGARNTMILAALTYEAYVVGFTVPSLILFLSAVLGFGAALLWTAQGVFIAENSTSANMGTHSGIFWALLQSRLYLGNFVAYLLIGEGDTVPKDQSTRFFYALGVLGLFGIVVLFFLKPSAMTTDAANGRKLMPKESLQILWKLFWTPNMVSITQFAVFTGVLLTFWSGKYFTLISGQTEPDDLTLPPSFQPSAVAIAGIFLGTGEVLAGVVMGRVTDKLGLIKSALVSCLTCILAMGLFVQALYSTEPSLSAANFAGLLLGFADGAFNVAGYAVIGRLFEDSAPAFALFKMSQSIAAAVTFFYLGSLPLMYPVLLVLVTLAVGTHQLIKVSRVLEASVSAAKSTGP